MLSKQLEDTTDKTGQKRIKAIARRVSTLAQVYDHLLGNEMTRTTDFGRYIKSLCLNLEEIQAIPDSAITLRCESESIILDLDIVTVLGLVAAELVTNSYEHAFPGGKGAINVSVHQIAGDKDMATMTVSDTGIGFTPSPESKRHGVGLIKRLIEQIRGNVTVESDYGTIWTIRFPIGQVLADGRLT
jgi:two-component sensor histidine kinase